MATTNSRRKAFLQHQGLAKHFMEVLAINWKKRQWICFSLFASYPHPLPPRSCLCPNRELAIGRRGWGTAEGAAAPTPPLGHRLCSTAFSWHTLLSSQRLWEPRGHLQNTLQAHSNIPYQQSFLVFPCLWEFNFCFSIKLHNEIFGSHLNVLTKLCRREELRP